MLLDHKPVVSPADSGGGFPFKGKLFAKIDIRALINLREIRKGFRQVPLDPYVRDGTRFKDIARFTISGPGEVIKAPHGDLFHPINAKTYGGNQSRTYTEIRTADIEPLSPLVEIFARIACIDPGREILLQRQRVMVNNHDAAPTVQEGMHQDGLQKLAILCIDRENIRGGVSSLYDDRRDRVFIGTLKPGEILFVDDARLWHDATPIFPLDPGHLSYRDVILLNWPAERKEDHIQDDSNDIAHYYGA